MEDKNYLIIKDKETGKIEKIIFYDTKQQTEKLKNQIAKQKVEKLLQNIIKTDGVVDKKLINELEKKFIQTSYAPIIEFIYHTLDGQTSTELLKNYFKAIYLDKNIDDSTKILFSDFLAQFVLPGAGEDNMHNPMKLFDLIDYLKKIYPKYDWNNKVKEDFPLE